MQADGFLFALYNHTLFICITCLNSPNLFLTSREMNDDIQRCVLGYKKKKKKTQKTALITKTYKQKQNKNS